MNFIHSPTLVLSHGAQTHFQPSSFYQPKGTVYERSVEEYEEAVLSDAEVEEAYFFEEIERESSTSSFDSVESSPNSLCNAIWQNLGTFEVTQIAKKEEAYLNIPDTRNFTPLHYSCSSGNSDLTRELVRRGCDTSCRDKNGCTPLMHAVIQANYEVVATLLELAADVNLQNNSGESALHLAALNGDERIVFLLLERGALIEQQTLEGLTGFEEKKKKKRRRN
jgi:ankyrin repeat protein